MESQNNITERNKDLERENYIWSCDKGTKLPVSAISIQNYREINKKYEGLPFIYTRKFLSL